MSTSDINYCNDSASKSNDDGVREVNDMLQNMSTTEDEEDNNCTDIYNTCANCGKEGSDVMNTCNKCQSVMYCNASCKKKHRHKHKKACEKHQRLAAERAAEVHDEALFKRPPPVFDDCPICFQRMPSLPTGSRYKSCCGKDICSGCSHAPVYDNRGNKVTEELCAFCRIPAPQSDEEVVERIKKRADASDVEAIYLLAGIYDQGIHGVPHDHTKALELYQ